MKIVFCICLFLFSNINQVFSQSDVYPKKIGCINDYGHLLDSDQIIELTSMIDDYEQHNKKEITILTIDSITPNMDFLRFAAELCEFWEIGDNKYKSGLLIAVCVPCRSLCIVTGYTIKKGLSDKDRKKIILNIISPKFQENKYYEGLKDGIISIKKEWK